MMLHFLPKFPKAGDWKASIVVFVISVPMALGVSLASGVPISAGFISAVIGGIVVGLFAGAPLQITGPSAALAVVIFGMVQKFGFSAVCTMTVGAGLLQIAVGYLRIPQYSLALSPAIIYGMVGGMGILIALSQLQVLLGISPQGNNWQQLGALAHSLLQSHGPQIWVGGVTILSTVLWQWVPKKWSRLVPSAIVGVLVGTMVALPMDLPRISLPTEWGQFFSHPSWIPLQNLGEAALATLTIAVIASAESLVSTVAKDKMHGRPLRANLNRELMAQGVGNTLSGLIGGLPMSGAIARSTASIQAGAETRWTTILQGIWLLVALLAFRAGLALIPKCVLAALLVVVGIKLINIAQIRNLYRHREISIYFITLAGVVCFNLVIGLLVGFAAATLRLLFRLAQVNIHVEYVDQQQWLFQVQGSLTFMSVPKLTAWLDRIPEGAYVRFELNVDSIDHAAFEALQDFSRRHEKTGGRVELNLAPFRQGGPR